MVHSTEWTTGASRKWLNSLKKPQMSGASGPLGGVDHWRAKKVAEFPQKVVKSKILCKNM
ncbi:hypothetical protein GCWU000182_00263 [Abiotrophia defectiva ATCC 49176]|uniref:Uncharacterized protein n=1 Tax=Abiotrophia defectiva ATCC 49176 TaxID=592010 RepID=W1Q5M0_ABIDE|nr:hypothetical protein GCWU000182_00263 [Abiotrophia defectiva ATCC 49176]